MNNRLPASKTVEAGSLSSGCSHGRVRALFWVIDFLLCFHRTEGGRDLSGVSRLGSQHRNFAGAGGHKHFEGAGGHKHLYHSTRLSILK